MRFAPFAVTLAFIAFAATIAPLAHAVVSEVQMSRGPSLGFLPSMIMEDRKLIEKHADAAGLGKVTVSWFKFSGGVAMNDATRSRAVGAIGIVRRMRIRSARRGSSIGA
jgi:NitT/TauT family transport system substrate-binding protein